MESYLPCFIVIANLRARRRIPRAVGASAGIERRRISGELGKIDTAESITETNIIERTAKADFGLRVANYITARGSLISVYVVACSVIWRCCDNPGSAKDNQGDKD